MSHPNSSYVYLQNNNIIDIHVKDHVFWYD